MTHLPRLVVCTDRRGAARAGRRLVETVADVVAAGARAVLFREKDLDPGARRTLAEQLLPVLGDARLLIASDPLLAEHLDAAGVHFAAGDPRPSGTSPGALLGRSCHNRAAVERAREEGLQYVTVSPFAPTRSKPGYGPALGIAGVGDLVAAAAGMPVLALGGVLAEHVRALRGVGAYGIAVMGGVMAARDPATVVTQLLDALAQPMPVPAQRRKPRR